MRTKILSLLMILSMGIFITSCGKDKKDEPTPETVDNHFTVAGYKYSLQAMYVYHDEARGGYNFLLIGDENAKVAARMKTAPDCPWFAIDIPEEDLNTVINDPEKLDGEDWSFYFAESHYKERVRSRHISSVRFEFKQPTKEIFRISLKAQVGDKQIELEWSGKYTELDDYIVSFYPDDMEDQA